MVYLVRPVAREPIALWFPCCLFPSYFTMSEVTSLRYGRSYKRRHDSEESPDQKRAKKHIRTQVCDLFTKYLTDAELIELVKKYTEDHDKKRRDLLIKSVDLLTNAKLIEFFEFNGHGKKHIRTQVCDLFTKYLTNAELIELVEKYTEDLKEDLKNAPTRPTRHHDDEEEDTDTTDTDTTDTTMYDTGPLEEEDTDTTDTDTTDTEYDTEYDTDSDDPNHDSGNKKSKTDTSNDDQTCPVETKEPIETSTSVSTATKTDQKPTSDEDNWPKKPLDESTPGWPSIAYFLRACGTNTLHRAKFNFYERCCGRWNMMSEEEKRPFVEAAGETNPPIPSKAEEKERVTVNIREDADGHWHPVCYLYEPLYEPASSPSKEVFINYTPRMTTDSTSVSHCLPIVTDLIDGKTKTSSLETVPTITRDHQPNEWPGYTRKELEKMCGVSLDTETSEWARLLRDALEDGQTARKLKTLAEICDEKDFFKDMLSECLNGRLDGIKIPDKYMRRSRTTTR